MPIENDKVTKYNINTQVLEKKLFSNAVITN